MTAHELEEAARRLAEAHNLIRRLSHDVTFYQRRAANAYAIAALSWLVALWMVLVLIVGAL